jgi:5-methylcytosine-specific restriction endonuclease McrA
MYSNHLQSDYWKEIRYKAHVRDGFKCVDCGDPCELETHHVSYERLGREWLSDLVTLCRSCHSTRHASSPNVCNKPADIDADNLIFNYTDD